ncbi:DUF1768-domain-containing protein [Scleroderma yunnanense]
MGGNSSRPVVSPTPVPGMVPVIYDALPKSRNRRRAFSTSFAYRPAATYGYPMYPQMTAYHPRPQPQPQFAPVQVSFMTQPQQQPMQPVQTIRPVLSLPQAFMPVTAAQPVVTAPAPAVYPVAATVQAPRVTQAYMPPADRVIPPPPVVMPDTPRMHASRTRFTNFYRPANGPMPMSDLDVPFRPPFVPPITDPMRHNPLPQLPADIWENSPYRKVLNNRPRDSTQLLSPTGHLQQVPFDPVEPRCHDYRHYDHPSMFSSLFGSRGDTGKGKSNGGLFRSHGVDMPSDLGPSNRHDHDHHRAPTVTNIVIPPPPVPESERPPPIKFNHLGDLGGFVNHSRHRILYRNKTYPSAVHLLESMKFVDKPDIAERIRLALDADEVYRLSTQYHEHVRPDWGHVFLKVLDDVLYLKFKQHPTLRRLLLNTGIADIVYADTNDYWGEGSNGEGENKLGSALVRVRDRLRREGERYYTPPRMEVLKARTVKTYLSVHLG